MIVSQYPNIVLHDGFVEKIIIDGCCLYFIFKKKNGFWVKENDVYYRTENASISVKLKEMDSYKIVRKKSYPYFGIWACRRYDEISIASINKEINEKKSEFQIVNELYNPDSLIIIAHLGLRGMCYIYADGTELNYYWDELDYDNRMY